MVARGTAAQLGPAVSGPQQRGRGALVIRFAYWLNTGFSLPLSTCGMPTLPPPSADFSDSASSATTATALQRQGAGQCCTNPALAGSHTGARRRRTAGPRAIHPSSTKMSAARTPSSRCSAAAGCLQSQQERFQGHAAIQGGCLAGQTAMSCYIAPASRTGPGPTGPQHKRDTPAIRK